MSPLLISILIVVISILALFIWCNARMPKEPPGPFRFPIIGNMLQIYFLGKNEPFKAYTELGKRYGDIFSVKLGTINAVVFNSYELMEKYMRKHEFSDRYCNEWFLERTFSKRLGMVNGEYGTPEWSEIKKFSMRSLSQYGFGKTTKMHSILEEEVTNSVEEMKKMAKENGGVVTIGKQFAVSNINLVWATAAGKRYPLSDPKFKQLVNNVHSFASSFNMASSFCFCYPSWYEWLPFMKGHVQSQRKGLLEINTFFKDFMTERRKIGKYLTEPECMIDEYLREMDTNEENKSYTDEHLAGLLSDLFFAGSVTTSATIGWCFLHLLLNPEVQRKVQEEVDAVVPKGKFPIAETEAKLHYVKATIAETHRIGTATPMMAPRGTLGDEVCENFIIRKGTFIMSNIYKLHFDEKYWKDPHTFRPERFLDKDGIFKNDERLRAFGFGKRRCPGEGLTQLDLTYFVTMYMQHFTFLPVPGEPLPRSDPLVTAINQPHPFRALLVSRDGKDW
ncbi:unnamed protein product [Orchesella dallaii]|uniref:Methyl farnesoate epoxidase n=1 Tax=Orchesella dallaii TaxID=48710 RepID=A0ABP1S7Y3_9HEXA